MNNDLISRSAVLERLETLRRNYTLKAGYREAMTDAIGEVRSAPAIDAVQIVTNGQDTTYLRVKSLDELRGRIVIDEESGNRCAMYYEEAEDAVPVVRCKDCIHAVAITNLTVSNRCGLGQKNCMRQRGDDGFGFAGVSVVYPDGFCDEGARMDGESEEDTDGSQTD